MGNEMTTNRRMSLRCFWSKREEGNVIFYLRIYGVGPLSDSGISMGYFFSMGYSFQWAISFQLSCCSARLSQVQVLAFAGSSVWDRRKKCGE